MVALFEKGVTVPAPSSRAAHAASLSSQPSATSVSLLSSTTSRPGCARMPSFTLATKPALRACASNVMRPSAATPRSQAESSGSGLASSSTITSCGVATRARSTLSMQRRVSGNPR